MSRFLIFLTALSFLTMPLSVEAADSVKPDEGQLLVPPPMIDPPSPDGSRCFIVKNTAPYTVLGSVVTNYVTDLAGRKGRQMSTFRLAPNNQKQYCTMGPYYPGTRIAMMLKTVVPVFSCYTVAQGTIEIKGEFLPGGKTHSWINCQ